MQQIKKKGNQEIATKGLSLASLLRKRLGGGGDESQELFHTYFLDLRNVHDLGISVGSEHVTNPIASNRQY